MRKKGVSHIEVIFAFVIFIGFLVFALFFFNPFQSDRLLDRSLYYTIDELNENVSVALETYSVVIEATVPNGEIAIPIDDSISENLVVYDADGNNLIAEYDSANQLVLVDRTSEDFITIWFSEELTPNPGVGGTPTTLTQADYTVSSTQTDKVVSERKVLELKQIYETDYVSLKKYFNLPGRVDFGFRIKLDETSIVIAERDIPEGIEVFTKTERVEFLRNNGELLFADFTVQVW